MTDNVTASTGRRRFCTRPCAAALVAAAACAAPLIAGDAQPLTGRRLLELNGVASDVSAALAAPADTTTTRDALLRTMRAMQRIEQHQRLLMTRIERQATGPTDWEQLAGDPRASFGQLVRLQGRVTEVDTARPAPDAAERYEIDEVFTARVVADLPGHAPQPAGIDARVFTLALPRGWLERGRLDESASVTGFLVGFAPQQNGRLRPMIAAPRIAWHPPTPLGRRGMDVGLLDDIENRRGLVAGDRECFYQMLAAVGRGADPNLSDGADDKYRDVVPLFNEPDDAQGRLYELEGTARRAMRIAVVDEDVRERLGFDHYYEVDVFPDDAQGNPVVFCMRELPARMPQGPEIEERVRAAGFFMKVWRYRRFRPSDTAEQGEGGEPVLQLAPLLIGREPVWIPAPGLARNNYAAAVLGAMFLVVLGGIWLVVWRSSRTERRRAHMGADAAHLPVDGAPLGTSSREPDGNAGVDPAR